ncbi:MAG: PadR family transcriptional regulator [Acidobacteriota bacterium]
MPERTDAESNVPAPAEAGKPLSPTDFHLLLALSRRELYGYRLLQDMAEDSGGALRPDIGSLYRVLHRLQRRGWIADAGERSEVSAPGKPRRYYRITEAGADALSAEVRRLRRALRLAGERGFGPAVEGAP